MSDRFNPSVAFSDLLFFALDHVVSSIEDAGGPLISFAVVVDHEGHRKLHRFVTEQLEDGVANARKFVSEHKNEIQMYAIAWDGFVTLEGKRTDAILVEAGDPAEAKAALLCQRYVPETGKPGIQRMGNPALIDRPESLFGAESKASE